MSFENDILRLHDRIDRIEDEHKEIRTNFFNTMQSVNKNLVELNTKMDANDENTKRLCKAVKALAKSNQRRKHEIEMHAAECGARTHIDTLKQAGDPLQRAKLTIKEHPIISAGSLTGIVALIGKLIEAIL